MKITNHTHTPTPWRIATAHVPTYGTGNKRGTDWRDIVTDALPFAPSHIGEALSTDARRIVAAVNAVEGIDTDILESLKDGAIAALLKQRADLLAACKKLLSVHDANTELGGTAFYGAAEESGVSLEVSDIEKMRVTIAKAEKGAA